MKKIIIILLIVLLLGGGYLWWTSRYKQVGSSMTPTIENNDIVLVNKFNRNIEFGDIIVFKYNDPKNKSDAPAEILMKRVMGIPGDTIEIKDGSVIRNGETIDEPYLSKENKKRTYVRDDQLSKYEVPDNKYFVLGENRNHSSDSRSFANTYIDINMIIGTAIGY